MAKAKQQNTITEFKLWKDNKIAGEWKISVADAVERFKQSIYWQHHLDGSQLDRCLLNFLSAPENEGGMQSTYEISDWDKISLAMFKMIYP